MAEATPPAYAVVDMRLEDGNGLDVIELIRRKRPDSRMVVLTGYGNIATAVTAVKLGAVDYLAKPADADEVIIALDPRARREAAAAGKSDVGRPRPLGAYPARLRALRPQCLGDRAPAQHASPHPAAHPRQARAALEQCQESGNRFSVRHCVKSRNFTKARRPRIDQTVQAVRRGLGETQEHGLARRAGEPVLRRLAQDLGAVGVGEDQAGILREDLERHRRHGWRKTAGRRRNGSPAISRRRGNPRSTI